MSDEQPLSFLKDASVRTLQDFELAKRNAAANHRKEIIALLNLMIDDLVWAEIAATLRHIRRGGQELCLPGDIGAKWLEKFSGPK